MNLALFDFDGTLTTRETFGDFVRHAVTPLRRALGAPLFAPMLAGYKLGLVSGFGMVTYDRCLCTGAVILGKSG